MRTGRISENHFSIRILFNRRQLRNLFTVHQGGNLRAERNRENRNNKNNSEEKQGQLNLNS